MKTVILSGGSKGLGKGLVEGFLRMPEYAVSTFSRSSTPFVEEMAIKYPERFHFEKVDVSDSKAVNAYVKNVKSRFGGVDILINNAGMAVDGLIALMQDEDIVRVMDVNLKGTVLLTRACVRDMLLKRWGRIVNISSIVGKTGYKGLSVYSLTKAGLDGFTRSLARELGDRGITVNSVAPGFLETEMTHGLNEQQRQQIIKRTPAGRLGNAGDVAPLLLFLVSEASGFITGQTIVVDGGITA